MSQTRRAQKHFASHRHDAAHKAKASLSLFRFVLSLEPFAHDGASLKGRFLIISPDDFRILTGAPTIGNDEIAIVIEQDITAGDILALLPMPLQCEALEFAQFAANQLSSDPETRTGLRAAAGSAVARFLEVKSTSKKRDHRRLH